MIGVRINKYFSNLFSRRALDVLIKENPHRIQVFSKGKEKGGNTSSNEFLDYLNNPLFEAKQGEVGMLVSNNDVIFLDKKRIVQSSTNSIKTQGSKIVIKLFKAEGIECTCNLSIENNIQSYLQSMIRFRLNNCSVNEKSILQDLLKCRLFPIGRLDKESTGLILLTNDGALSHSLCTKQVTGRNNAVNDYDKIVTNDMHDSGVNVSTAEKIYHVWIHKAISDDHLRELSRGIMLTDQINRNNSVHKEVTYKTLPCKIRHVDCKDSLNVIEITLEEGRNRQIRRMFGSLGYKVVHLQRVEFAGIKLSPCKFPGDFHILTVQERQLLTSYSK